MAWRLDLTFNVFNLIIQFNFLFINKMNHSPKGLLSLKLELY